MSSLLHRNTQFTGILDFARLLLGFTLDPVQTELLTTTARFVLLNCHRQWGKTTIAALRAFFQAYTVPGQTIIVLAPTLRQSRVLTKCCRDFAHKLGLKVTTDGSNPLSIVFPNGSVILPLPANADHVRGFSAHLLIIDEAACVSDEVFSAVTPLIAATQGHLWLISTPKGKRGFFYEEAIVRRSSTHPWHRLKAPAAGPRASGRIPAEHVVFEQERKTVQQFAQEFLCDFTTADRSVFDEDVIARAFNAAISAFNLQERDNCVGLAIPPHYYLGLDLGGKQDHSVLVILEYRTTPAGTVDPYFHRPLYRRQLFLRAIERFPLGTAFEAVIARVALYANHPQIKDHGSLVVDATGLGDPVVQRIQQAKLPLYVMAITITGGQHATVTPHGRNVPKQELITRLELMLEQGHIQIAANINNADLLRQELLQYERTYSPVGQAAYGPAGSKGHDDIVLALSLAGYWAWTNRCSYLAGDRHKPLNPF